MKKQIMKTKLSLCFALCMLAMPLATMAKDFYGVLDGSTLTFYYDDNMASRNNVYYTSSHWTDTNVKDKIFKAVFDISVKDYHPEGASCAYMFINLKNLKTIESLNYLDTRRLTSMVQMFYGCWNLEKLDLSGFDMQNVTSMYAMFEGCQTLKEVNLQFKTQTSKLTNMECMFDGCEYLQSVDLGMFETKNVTNMSYMFDGCSNLRTVENMYFNAQSAPDMSFMFRNCGNLQEIDLSNFSNTEKITQMTRMFEKCSSLKTANLGNFIINKIEKVGVADIFANCSSLTTIYCNEDWTEGNLVEDGSPAFRNCYKLVGGCGTAVGESAFADGYAHPDVPGRPGVFTATEGLYFNGHRLTKDNAQSFVQKGTMSYDPDEETITMKEAYLTGDGGFWAAGDETLWLNFSGANTISTKGTTFQLYDLFPCANTNGATLNIISSDEYGVVVKNTGAFSGGESTTGYIPEILISGKLGAVRGEEAYNSYYGKNMRPRLILGDMRLSLKTDGSHPVVSGLSKIDDEQNVAFSYDGYSYDEELMAVVDNCVDNYVDNYWHGTVVTKPFKMVPKNELVQYPVHLGGHYLNNLNCFDFCPMSLSDGSACYDVSARVLYLTDAKFNTPYIPQEDIYGLDVKLNNFTLQMAGDNDLTGTNTNDYDYGINIMEDDTQSGTRLWRIKGVGESASLKLMGTMYFECLGDENPANLNITDCSIKVSDKAYFWQQDDVSVSIVNSSLDLIDLAWPDMNIMEYLESLTLKDCKFENGCYFDSSKGCVVNAAGQPARDRIRITRTGTVIKKGDVNRDTHINTADVVAIYTFIEKGTASGFTREDANVNGDANVNTADVVALYDIIIKGSK